jgi:hypothetical protein
MQIYAKNVCSTERIIALIGALAVIAVVLQQLGAARDFTRWIVGAIESLRRSCEPFQMPTHRNVHASNPRTGHVVIVIENAFLVREY